MSRSFIVPGNFVRKSGDGMTGDLAMAPGKKVDGVDVSKAHRHKIDFYTGDGNDDRNIDAGVNLAAKNNVVVIVKDYTTGVGNPAAFRVEAGQGDISFFLDSTIRVANAIQTLTSTGFQIGSDARVNQNAHDYLYMIFWEEP